MKGKIGARFVPTLPCVYREAFASCNGWSCIKGCPARQTVFRSDIPFCFGMIGHPCYERGYVYKLASNSSAFDEASFGCSLWKFSQVYELQVVQPAPFPAHVLADLKCDYHFTGTLIRIMKYGLYHMVSLFQPVNTTSGFRELPK